MPATIHSPVSATLRACREQFGLAAARVRRWCAGDAWPRILPFALYMAFIAGTDLLQRLGWSGAQLRWLYVVKIMCVLATLLYYRRRYSELARQRMGLAVAAAAVAAGALVMVLWIRLDADWMTAGHSAGFDPREGGAVNWLLAAPRLAGAALVVPVMEELFWRSFLLRWVEQRDFLVLSPARIKTVAFIVTVILFGFEHNLWLAGIIAGAVYGALYMRSGNLWTAILAHGITNGLLGGWIISTAHWSYW